MIRIFCVLVKPKYTLQHVYNLYNMLKEHCSHPFELVCLTDSMYNSFEALKFIDINEYDLDTWWNKVLVFDNRFSSDHNLYFDLDIVINHSIDGLVNQLDDTHIFTVDTPWKNKQYFDQKYKGVRAYKIADALFKYGNTSVMGWKGNNQYLVDMLLSDIFTHTSKHFGDDTFIHQHGKIKHFEFDIKRAGDGPAAILI